MEILRSISLYTEDKAMPFAVIGGHAVNSYGIQRHTADLDLVVQLSAKDRWLELMNKLAYQKGQDDKRFARFRPRSLNNWPIDLMFVDDVTFGKLIGQAKSAIFGETTVKVVSARHLAIMKLHALKHYQIHRYSKDLSDLTALLRSGATGISNQELKDLCQKYAEIGLYDKLVEETGG